MCAYFAFSSFFCYDTAHLLDNRLVAGNALITV